MLNLLTAHFMFASYTSLFVIVPPYVLHRGGQEWQLGIIIGSFGIMGVLIRPFAGRRIGIIGPKKVAIAGSLILGFGSLLSIPALSAWWIVPVRMIQGMGLAIGPVATSTMTANLAPARRRAEAMAYMGNAISIAGIYAPVLSFWILDNGGFHNAFLYSAINAGVSALLALKISSSRTRGVVPQASGEKSPLVAKAALFPTIVFLTFTFTTAPVNAFLPILAQQQNLGNPGWYFTVYSITSIVAMSIAGPIADRFGRPTVIVPGLLMTGLGMFVLMTSFYQLMFLAAGFLTGIGFGMIQPGIQSLTIDRVPQKDRGAGMATLQQAWDVGGSGGAFALGPVASGLGVANTFGIVGVGALVGAVGFVMGNARSSTKLPDQQQTLVSSSGDDG